MKNVLSLLCIAIIAINAFAIPATQWVADKAVHSMGPIKQITQTDDPWDLLFSSLVGITVSDNQLLGVEFAEDFLYVTGGNSGMDPNKVYIFYENGSLYSEFEQWNSSGWGWRDLADDGTYLYAAGDSIFAFDLVGNPVPEMSINIFGGYGLAYDPATDHFWTNSLTGYLIEFDRDGNIISEVTTGLSAYGLAWDNYDPEGPWLWIHSQDAGCSFHQYDPYHHVLTGLSYVVPLLPGLTSQIAGGAFTSEEWNPGLFVIGGIAQGTPEDAIFILELYEMNPIPDVMIELTYVSGPGSTGNLIFDFYLENQDPNPVDFDAWLDVEYEGGAPWTVVMRSFTNFQPGWTINRPNVFFPVGNTWPAGNYMMWGRVGNYPDEIWDESGFPWVKSGISNSTASQPFVLEGLPNPFERIDVVNEPVVTDFALIGAYPNPFNPITTIKFSLAEAGVAKLTVHDISGREVVTLTNGYRNAGSHEVTFYAANLTSGVYFYQLTASGKSVTGKMLLLK